MTSTGDMAVVRRLDAEAMALQRQGELALWAPLLGQEAAQVGSARALRPDDFVFPSYREHGVAYCRGVDPVAHAAPVAGHRPLGLGPRRATASPPRPSSSARRRCTPPATRSGITLDGATSAALTYFGDGATSEGDVAEAFGFAASYVVPVVFFCQNNQWAISEPVRLQSHASIAQRGQGYGIPGIQVDGNDVLAVLAATRLALARAYGRPGPDPHRGRDLPHGPAHHVGRPHPLPHAAPRRRSGGSRTRWPACGRCCAPRASPTTRFDGRRRRRRGRGGRRAARRRAWPCPTPSRPTLFAHVYAEPHPLLEEERDAYAEYLAGFDEEPS